jgi:enolase
MQTTSIQSIEAREVLDSRGNPTLWAEVQLTGGAVGSVIVPAGASLGTYEACELRDMDLGRYGGKGVQKAIANIQHELLPAVRGLNALDQAAVDQKLIETDGSDYKKRLGANSILSISLAVARAAASASQEPLYKYLNHIFSERAPLVMPVPMIKVLSGGRQSHNNLDFQEFMIIPVGAPSFGEAIRYGAETFHVLKILLEQKGLITSVGDEGGFAPNLTSNTEAIELIIESIKMAHYVPGRDIAVCLDAAATALTHKAHYELNQSSRGAVSDRTLSGYYSQLAHDYPIFSIEDPFGENDVTSWQELTNELGDKVQLVGDDLFVTNPEFLERGVQNKIANAVLIKPNQIGTLTETLRTIRIAQKADYSVVISGRSGESEDTFIADLAVATGAGQIKAGSLCRSERVAKYNRLLLIEAQLNKPSFGTTQFRSRRLKAARKL